MVSGISSREEAKIGGITPAVLTLSGRWRALLPGCCRAALCPLRILDQHPALGPFHEADAVAIRASEHRDRSNDDHERVHRSRPATFEQLARARRSAIWATIPAMMISDTPLPMPRLVICSPSHIRNIVPPTRLMVATVIRNSKPGIDHRADWPVLAADNDLQALTAMK